MGASHAKCMSSARLDGKTAIVTGCNTGIGKCTVKDFFKRGAHVIMACRNLEKANQAANDIREECKEEKNLGRISIKELDLMNLNSVRNCAKNILQTEQRIDLLINNAGIMMCPEGRTEDQFEIQFGTNHLGHFLLTLLLLPKIIKSTPARIVNVSSAAHGYGVIDFEDLNFERKSYSSGKAYCQSKLANVLFTNELARKLKDANIEGVTTYSLHPGVIATELGRHLSSYILLLVKAWKVIARFHVKTPEEGAQTTIYCAVDKKCANETGLYYNECKNTEPSYRAKDEEVAKKLWEVSLNLVGLVENYNPFK